MRIHSGRFVGAAVIAVVLVLGGGPAFAGQGHHAVELCHKPGSPAEKTLTVDKSAVPGHLGHGDHLGVCVPVKPTPTPTPTPTVEPTIEPTPEPTITPTPEPTGEPTPEPTGEPTPEPTVEPTKSPVEPIVVPTPEQHAEPSAPGVERPATHDALAETGGDAMSPWLVAAALVLMGGGAFAFFRARNAKPREDDA